MADFRKNRRKIFENRGSPPPPDAALRRGGPKRPCPRAARSGQPAHCFRSTRNVGLASAPRINSAPTIAQRSKLILQKVLTACVQSVAQKDDSKCGVTVAHARPLTLCLNRARLLAV